MFSEKKIETVKQNLVNSSKKLSWKTIKDHAVLYEKMGRGSAPEIIHAKESADELQIKEGISNAG